MAKTSQDYSCMDALVFGSD